jgi:cellulose synthase/poly-beta-1,6-N-acetylglucosamine synthase-like glycosyltransferase
MDISLIICTRDRCRKLVHHLESLHCITFERSWEIIIVDNGSVDETAAVVHEFIRSASAPVIFESEPRLGKSNALNTALAIAQGEIIVFTDDDCYPAPDFLSRVWTAFQNHSVGYVTGRVLLHDPADAPEAINESTIPLTFPGRRYLYPGTVMGANMAFRRQVLSDVGGFDPLFGPGAPFHSTEDLDVGSRASAKGWMGQYHPEVIVRHHHERRASDVARLAKYYAIGTGAYYVKLLLRGHEFLWFARGVYEFGGRITKWYGGRFFWQTIFWEAFGAAKYVYYIVRGVINSP